MVKTVLSFFIGLLMIGSLTSCMDDPITTNEAIPQNIYRPNSIGFRFLEHTPGSPTGSIRVYWSNSSSDVQDNFGGYVVRLLGIDTILVNNTSIERQTPLAQKVVDKTTFGVVFDDVLLFENYKFAVWGMRNPATGKPDSLILSRDSMATPVPVIFDPRPLDNPTVIRAASTGPTNVRLEWDRPSTQAQGNVLSYVVYYRDPSRVADSAKVWGDVQVNDTTGTYAIVSVPPAVVGQGISVVKEYEFWVKAIRDDSTQFYDDSTLIRWSGGERFTLGRDSISGGLHLGKSLFIGNLQGQFGAQERDLTDDKSSMKFEDAGENVLVTGLRGTRFYAQIDGFESLDTAAFSSPLPESAFDQETLLLPKIAPKNGWIIYARLFGNKAEPLRLIARGSNIVTVGNALNLEMIYQPERGTAPPLPYF